MLIPELVHVKSIEHNTEDVFTLALSKEKEGEERSFLPGQFNMLYLYGFGEVAISISGDPARNEGLVHTIRAVGSVTEGLQRLKVGDELGVRGPFGTHWPFDKKGCDVLLIAGGVGMPPLRPAMLHLDSHRQDYNKITLLYGARTPQQILYGDDLRRWEEAGIDVSVTIDQGDETWNGQIGVVTQFIHSHLPHPENTLILICGPEIMIRYAIQELLQSAVDPGMVYLSMERNMQCGVGFCGHCQYGPYFLCKDGPVFSYEQIKQWLPIHEL